MVMPPGEAGTYRIHFTGSKEHNVRLRAMARDQGWSLSEKGFLRIGEDGEPLTGDAAELRTFATEAEAYAFLGLPFIEPELREDTGEIEAALAGRLPALVESGRPARRPPQPLRLVRRPSPDRGHGRGRPRARLRLPGPDRPLAVAGDRPRPDPGPGRGAGRGDRRAQRPVRGGGGGRHGPAGDTGRGLPAPPRLRARGPCRRRRSTSRTTCWRASTSSSRRSTSPGARPAPS